MNKLERQLYNTLNKYKEVSSKYRNKIAELRTKLKAEGCSHPEVVTYEWEHDNGYGRQSTCTGLRCVLCEYKEPYPLSHNPLWKNVTK